MQSSSQRTNVEMIECSQNETDTLGLETPGKAKVVVVAIKNESEHDDRNPLPKMEVGRVLETNEKSGGRIFLGIFRELNWERPIHLGFGLFLVLFPFWLLDSLKDPLLSALTLNLERHQPSAKLLSVVTTLSLVCLLEYVAKERSRSSKTDQESSQIRSPEEVMDGGGTWTRMSLADSLSRERVHTEEMTGVPSSIFASIGIPYCIAFGIMAYLLQFHALAQPRNASEESGMSYWHLLGYCLYAAIESYGSLAVAAFWSYTNSTLSLEQAEAFYGPIIAIAQLGAIGGSTMATTKYEHVTLVVLSCLVMILHIVVMLLYVRKHQPYHPDPIVPPLQRQEPLHQQKMTWRGREKISGKIPWLTGIYLILEHNFVILILGASCLYDISLTCLNYQMTLLGWNRHGAGESDGISFTRFMGRYGQLVNVLSLILSSAVFPWLMKNIGLRSTLRLFPTLLLVVNMIAFLALPGNLWVLFFSMSILKAMTYSIHDPSTEILYLPTAPQIKFQAKFWIDVVGKFNGNAFKTNPGIFISYHCCLLMCFFSRCQDCKSFWEFNKYNGRKCQPQHSCCQCP